MQIYGQTKLCRRCKRWQQLYIAKGVPRKKGVSRGAKEKVSRPEGPKG